MLNNSISPTSCIVSWSLKNIRHGENDAIVVKGTVVQIPDGYYSFTELSATLKKHKITIEKLANNKVELTCTEETNLKSFGPVLGFEQDKAITANTKYTSTKPAAMTNGLKEIYIFSSLIDSERNYTLGSNGYHKSELLLTIPIDTTQSLNGTLTKFDTSHQRLPIRDHIGQDIFFDVVSEGHVDDYNIYLTLVID